MNAQPSLQRRLLRRVLVVAAVTALLASGLTSYLAWQQAAARFAALAEQTIASLSVALVEPLWLVDIPQTESQLRSALKIEGVVRAELRTFTGQTYRHATTARHGEYLVRSASLMREGRSLGTLEIAIGKDALIDQVAWQVALLFGVVALFVALFGVLFYVTVRREIAVPLQQLAARMSAYEPGAPSAPQATPACASRELQQLAAAFEDMQAEISLRLQNERALREQVTALAQDALRASEEKLRVLYELAPLGIALTDMSGRYIEFNEAFRSICGYPADELKALDYWALTPREYEAQEAAQLEVLTRTRRYGPYEKEYVRKDGTRVPLRLNGVLVTGKDGQDYIWSIVEDITASRRTADEMRAAKEAAEAANLAKSRFLATMSHEIRTPMNGILGMAQLLLLPALSDAERQEYARTILDSGQILLALLNDILDFSKVEAGKLELAHVAFDPQQVIEETAALFAEPAQSKGLEIETAWQGDAALRYRADPTRVRQMLANLVSNAVKFTTHGRVRIEAREIARAGDAALLEFAVADSGIGIPADKQELLFKPFSQADSSTTREYGGTGLGLSIVRSLARLMGGDVGVESAAGQGARFWFRIRAEVMDAGMDSRQTPRASSGGPVPPAGGRILVVEDNPTNRKVVEALLGKLGLHAQCVENGQAAVATVTQGGTPPDLVLMDVQMPVMSGLEATEAIRRWERDSGRPRLPIVALSAGAFAEDRRQCLDAGMDDFLAKPVNLDALATLLAKWLADRAAAWENSAPAVR